MIELLSKIIFWKILVFLIEIAIVYLLNKIIFNRRERKAKFIFNWNSHFFDYINEFFFIFIEQVKIEFLNYHCKQHKVSQEEALEFNT